MSFCNRIACIALIGAAACGGPSTTPCTPDASMGCLDVEGTYSEASAMATTACLSGDDLIWEGGEDTVTVMQSETAGAFGSSLVATNSIGEFGGTLHTDDSATFDSVPAMDSGGEPGLLYIEGQFNAGTPLVFDATYTFVRDSDQCHATGTAEWTRD